MREEFFLKPDQSGTSDGQSDGIGSWYRHPPCTARTEIIYRTASAFFWC